jgi:hypothetical protein
MLLQELKNQANQLPLGDRLELMRSIIESIQTTPNPNNRSKSIKRMKGLLKNSQPAPNDAEVSIMLEQHRMEKYL